MVTIYKFCKDKISIQPPREPPEHHLSEVRPKSSSYTNCHKRQYYQKGLYTLVDFLKNCKNKLKLKSKLQKWKNIVFGKLL